MLRRSLALLVSTVAVLAAAVVPAWAHGDDGAMTITAAEQVGEGLIRLEVGMLYANDDDPAEEATVEATLTGDDGTVVGPVPLPNVNSAVYGAEVPVPGTGTWDVAVTSTGPTASATAAVPVAEAPATTTTTAAETTTTTAAEPEGTADADDDGAEAAAADADDDDDDGGSQVAVLVAIGVVVVAALAGGGYALSRRRSG